MNMRYFESLNKALHELMQQDERVILLGEDVLDPYGGAFKVTRGLSTAFPNRVLTTPISEAGITGFAIGLALRGFRPVLEIMFGDFLALCADQLINGAAKFSWMYNGKVQMPLVIRTPMGGRRGYGPTHSQTLEKIFMGVPEITMVAPSHYHDAGELLKRAVLKGSEPTLFIENKSLYPQPLLVAVNSQVDDFYVYEDLAEDYPTVSLSLAADQRPDVVLIAYGGMAPLAVEAARAVFMTDEIVVQVMLPSLIKPFPLADVLSAVQRAGRVAIVEEASVYSGWGAEVGQQITSKAFDQLRCPVGRVGAQETPIPSSVSLETGALPQVEDIVKALRAQLQR